LEKSADWVLAQSELYEFNEKEEFIVLMLKIILDEIRKIGRYS